MIFECKKTENCFADAETYEYRLPVTADAFSRILPYYTVSINRKFRRPFFEAAHENGTRVKGVLNSCMIKASFPHCAAETTKADFEELLRTI